MKAQCERCKEIVPLEFTVVPGGIDITCGQCGAHYHVPETAGPAPSVPLPSGEMVCPKCGEAQPPAPACRRCGLVQAKWRGPDAAGGGEADPSFVRGASQLWDACEARWEDPVSHEAFLGFCQRSGTFAFAAARYRSALQDRGGQDPIAEERLRQVRSLAEFAFLRPTRSTAEDVAAETTPYRNTVIVLSVGLALLVAGFVYLLVTHH